MDTIVVSSIQEFVGRVTSDTRDRQVWPYAWFRGEPKIESRLVPRLYRGKHRDENKLLQFFRMKAATFADGPLPDREATDQWLFLAQHVGLPTRLLDWTEGALIALFFALREQQSVVWLLNPIELNRKSLGPNYDPDDTGLPLTWISRPDFLSIGSANINAAWELDNPRQLNLPAAVPVTNMHPRMSAQRSCVTVQGRNKGSLADLAPDVLRCYELTSDAQLRAEMRDDLRRLGIDHSTVFPDLEGLAKELDDLY